MDTSSCRGDEIGELGTGLKDFSLKGLLFKLEQLILTNPVRSLATDDTHRDFIG